MPESIITFQDAEARGLKSLLSHYNLIIKSVPTDKAIPGSFWGDSEAGLIDNTLYLRPDTPLHSALHEACHYICMDNVRREGLHTNAGGDYDEENAVCYLQILLADKLKDVGRSRMQQDMDAWGYSFRLGSTRKWFEEDAEDAKTWLLHHKIIDNDGLPTWTMRQD